MIVGDAGQCERWYQMKDIDRCAVPVFSYSYVLLSVSPRRMIPFVLRTPDELSSQFPNIALARRAKGDM